MISNGAERTPQTGDTQCGKSAVLDIDALDLRLRLGCLGQLDRQNPVLEGCLRLFAIHTGRERNCPVDRAVAALGEEEAGYTIANEAWKYATSYRFDSTNPTKSFIKQW